MNNDFLNKRMIPFGKYNWIVLACQYGKSLLLSADNVCEMPWDTLNEDAEYVTSEIRDWLNDDFLCDSFTYEEAIYIEADPSTKDKIFLLSIQEALSYMYKLTANKASGHWWLRDSYDRDACFWNEGVLFGDINWDCDQKFTLLGVRPALWIDNSILKKYEEIEMQRLVREGYDSLAECLTWSDDNDFGIPMPNELLRALSRDYEEVIIQFLSALENASLEDRQDYYKQMYEVLYTMAARNDAESINKVFALCPGLEPEGYYSYDQVLPLGEAIENESYDAINALLNNGCDIDTATFSVTSTIEFATQFDSIDRMVPFLIDKGVSVQFQDIIDLWIWNNKPELARMVIDSLPIEDVHGFVTSAKEYVEDISVYCYGSLDSQQKVIFGELVEYLIQKQ